jgi:flagellar biosynthesis/type III secretory pathway chaperone
VSELYEDLTGVLAAEADALRELVPLLDEQEVSLTRADAGRVAAVMFRQAPVLRRLLRLDQRRQALVGAIADALDVESRGLSLAALLQRMPSAPAALWALHAELRGLLEAIDVRNRRNAFLIERAVACIEGLVREVMAPAPEPAPVYVATGRQPGRPGRARLVDRSA